MPTEQENFFVQPKIDGYRQLSQWDAEMINVVKKHAEEVGQIVEMLAGLDVVDQRWVAIAKTDLQKGFMSLVRSIAQPTTF